MKKRMKLPNNFGSIIKLPGRRRKPWAVRKKIDGHYKYLGYFETYEKALTFLVEYNKDPSVYAPSLITFAEIYQQEMAERCKKIQPVTARSYRTAFNNCAILHNRKFVSLKVADLQKVITDLSERDVGQPEQKKVRQLFHNLYSYAVKYQIIPQTADISHFIDVDKYKPTVPKSPFNTRQLNRVKALAATPDPLAPWATTVLMMCYAGMRPGEFLRIKKSDVKLKSRLLTIGKSKTVAGENRIIPISLKTLPYFEAWMERPGATLISDDEGNSLSYGRFARRFKKVMVATNCKHTPHECRHTTATNFNNKGANMTSVKRILGHADKDVTTGVYTHKDIRQLKKAIDVL